MSKIPTAEEFAINFLHQTYGQPTHGDTEKALKKFAKLHVKAALEEIADKSLDEITSWSGNPYTGQGSDYLDRDKILKAYPDSNIT